MVECFEQANGRTAEHEEQRTSGTGCLPDGVELRRNVAQPLLRSVAHILKFIKDDNQRRVAVHFHQVAEDVSPRLEVIRRQRGAGELTYRVQQRRAILARRGVRGCEVELPRVRAERIGEQERFANAATSIHEDQLRRAYGEEVGQAFPFGFAVCDHYCSLIL